MGERIGAAGSASTAGIDLVFDGRCGVCTRAADWLRRRDRRGRIRLHPFQRPGVLERFGLAEAEAREAAWVIEPGGVDGARGAVRGASNGAAVGEGSPATRLRGAAAINRALDVALGVRVFLPVYRVPPIRWAQDRAYRWVAEHRYRLRGTTPWCTRHPEDCGALPGPSSCAVA